MANDTRIYVKKEEFERQISELDGRLSSLKQLLTQYENKKEEARRVWGEEDENQKKAIALCESAIAVVKQKIEATQNSKSALENVSADAYAIQSDIGARLEESKAAVDALLK